MPQDGREATSSKFLACVDRYRPQNSYFEQSESDITRDLGGVAAVYHLKQNIQKNLQLPVSIEK